MNLLQKANSIGCYCGPADNGCIGSRSIVDESWTLAKFAQDPRAWTNSTGYTYTPKEMAGTWYAIMIGRLELSAALTVYYGWATSYNEAKKLVRVHKYREGAAAHIAKYLDEIEKLKGNKTHEL